MRAISKIDGDNINLPRSSICVIVYIERERYICRSDLAKLLVIFEVGASNSFDVMRAIVFMNTSWRD